MRTAVGGAKRLERAILDEHIGKCSHSIIIQSVETDLSDSSECSLDGPWLYRASKKVIITYLTGDCGERRRISLLNLLRRGFCAPSPSGQLRFKFYSWLRFKREVKVSSRTVSAVMDDEKAFLDVLGTVSRFYSLHPRRAKEEGLEPHRGPQAWEDRHNLLQLHYYGLGWYTYFRLLTFKQVFASSYGDDRWTAFQADPWTDTLTEEHFELLLSAVHSKLRDNHSRYKHLFEAYAGPQCHEDRGTAARLQYNVLFVNRANASGRQSRRNGRPVASVPPQRTAAAASDTDQLAAFYLRVCVDCDTIRVLDASAAAKYPLGHYTYAERRQVVRFTCDRLVGISCDTPADIVACTAQDKPSTWVALGTRSRTDRLPPPAIQLRSLRVLDETDHTEETQVMASYHYRNDSRAVGWTGRRALLTRTSLSGVVTLGAAFRRRRFQAIPGGHFTAGRFTVDTPREAKCCQPWHDPIATGHEDPSVQLCVTSLLVLRDIHAVYESLRRVRCIVCKQQTPGLPYADWRVPVPERGQMVDLAAESIVSRALADSTLLRPKGHCTVTLDRNFDGANGTGLTDRDAWGICTTCSPSYCVDADNNVVSRPLHVVLAAAGDDADDFHDTPPPQGEQRAAADGAAVPPADSQDSLADVAPTSICLYSEQNLVATDVYSDAAYRLFVNTWTRAETMVLRPLHLMVTVMRLRANTIPFSKHGSICYPLKLPQPARRLPWYSFETLPFVVIVQNRSDGTSTEAMINMQTILRARHFMERIVPCKYNPGQTRTFYRFVGAQWTPFSNDNLAALQARLSERTEPSRPAGLRVLLVDDVHARADKALHARQFRDWLESGYDMANALGSAYRARCGGEGADTSEVTAHDLYTVVERYVEERACVDVENRHRERHDAPLGDGEDIDVTMRHVIDCSIANGWLLSSDAESVGQPVASALSRDRLLELCCEELEILSRECGNDEGGAGGVAAGATAAPQSERPDTIREQGIARTALHRIPMPPADRENPLPESMPGYMQMGFPGVFLSGDADPFQERKMSIRQPVTTWNRNLLRWMSRQPEAEGNVEFQFVVRNQLSRDVSGQEARVALLKTDDFPDGLPTKDELMNDPALCERVGRSLLCLQSKLEDSDAFWRVRKQEMIGVVRDLEDPPRWRPNAVPLEVILWQTRAIPYNHHPAIHRLCDDAAVSEALSDERFLNARLANTLRHPGIVSWVAAFMGEMDTLALARARYDASLYMVRSEWGANANPHVHRHIISESFSRFLAELQNSLHAEVALIDGQVRVDDPTLERDVSRSAVATRVDDAWQHSQQRYIARIGQFYTNWNAGFTKDGQRTFDFAYDRKTTVCRAAMTRMIDEALTTGNHAELDELYVRVINGTLRHTGHSGRGDAPSSKDGCATSRRVVDKSARKNARSAGRARPGAAEPLPSGVDAAEKFVTVCKRRMPRRLRTRGAVVPDAHDPRITQCETACNDMWIGGHDPFAILHILNNIDDKAVVPAWLARPPTILWHDAAPGDANTRFDMVLAQGSGDSSVEYALKYGFKPVAPVKTASGVLLAALERRDGDDNVDRGVVQRMYNLVSASLCQSIFQAVHKNWCLPLLLKNVDVRGFNLGGTRVVKPATADAAAEYVFAGVLQRFDGRHADSTVHATTIDADALKSAMSVREFCDRFTAIEQTVDGCRIFKIRSRRLHSHGERNRVCVRLLPHHGKASSNPKRAHFWKYARDIVLWCEPCMRSSDLMPPDHCAGDELATAAHWRRKYDALLASGVHVPLWVRRFHTGHTAPADDVAGELSEDDDSHAADVDEPPAATDSEGEERDLNATRVRDRFYQTALDSMIACRPEDIADAPHDADSRAAASVANPGDWDFQGQWLGDNVVNPDHVRRNYARLAALGAGDAAHSAPVTPSGRQRVLPRIVKRYLVSQRRWSQSRREWNAYDQAMSKWRGSRSSRHAEPVPPDVSDIRRTPPKALRAFLLGDPGAGKSTTLRATVHELAELLADDVAQWTDVIKLSAPTGCASFHMAHGATTIHRLYAIRVGQSGDEPLAKESKQFAALCERLSPDLGLIIFDEFSMIQRRMVRWIMARIAEANIDMDHVGVLFVGDPAQILPIGDSPVWSLRRQTDDGKDCCAASILGMVAFRELFRMPALDTLAGFDVWTKTAGKKPLQLTDDERAQVAQFRLAAFDGDYQTVYLNVVRRTVDNDEVAAEFTKTVIPSFRYGGASRRCLTWLRDNTATAEDMEADVNWAHRVTLHGHHWYNEVAGSRATVESDNARALVSFARERNTPVMAVNAQHLPANMAPKLQKLSAKEFRGVPAVFFACRGLPLMLLENVAPSVGLFNGAHVQFEGPLYLNDDLQTILTRREYDAKVVTSGVTLTAPIDTPGAQRERLYQIPVGSVILRVNGEAVDGDERRLAELVGASETVQLVFRTRFTPPDLPEFIVVRVPNYTDNGGPNVLGIAGADDLVPIRMAKRGRDTSKRSSVSARGDDRPTQFRVGPPLEGGSAFTGFKGQGATLQRVVAKVKAWVETPGFWTVVVSRVKHPKHLHIPDDQWPAIEELRMQRLNPDVQEAEIFERQMKINAAKTLRHHLAAEGDGEWTDGQNVIGDAVNAAWRRRHERDVAAEVCAAVCQNSAAMDVTLDDVQHVIDRMVDSEEGLLLARPLFVTQLQHITLLRYSRAKRLPAAAKRKSRSTSAATTRPAKRPRGHTD